MNLICHQSIPNENVGLQVRYMYTVGNFYMSKIWPYPVGDLISQNIKTIDIALDWLTLDLKKILILYIIVINIRL